MLYCDYTNNSSSTSSALVDVQLSASQNGEKLSPAVPKEDDPAINNYIAEVEPGNTVTICYAFSAQKFAAEKSAANIFLQLWNTSTVKGW